MFSHADTPLPASSSEHREPLGWVEISETDDDVFVNTAADCLGRDSKPKISVEPKLVLGSDGKAIPVARPRVAEERAQVVAVGVSFLCVV